MNFLINRCPSCGLSASTLCARCWYILNDVGTRESNLPRGLEVIETKPFTQRVLYRWDDRLVRQANVLREVILASKEHPSMDMMRLWSDEFYRRALVDGALVSKRDWILIAPPGRSGVGEEDHAGLLAASLSRMSRGKLAFEMNAFERIGKSRRDMSSQKTKSRSERAEIQFRISPHWKARRERAEGFIFVDDVIATGATANAAWVALGKPRAFESWAIAAKVREHAAGYFETSGNSVRS